MELIICNHVRTMVGKIMKKDPIPRWLRPLKLLYKATKKRSFETLAQLLPLSVVEKWGVKARF